MASVPNMRLSPAARPGLADQPGDTGEGEDFAQLLSTTVATPDESEAQPQEAAASGDDKPATGQAETPIAQADAILSLVALQAAPVQPAATPVSGDTAATLPTGTAAGTNNLPAGLTADPTGAAATTPPTTALPPTLGALAAAATIADPASATAAPATDPAGGASTAPAVTIGSPVSGAIANPAPVLTGPAGQGGEPVATNQARTGPAVPASPTQTIPTGPAAASAAVPAGSLAAELAKTLVGPKAAPGSGPALRMAGAKSALVGKAGISDPLVAAAEILVQAVPGPRATVRAAATDPVQLKGETGPTIATTQSATPIVSPLAPTSIADPAAAPNLAAIPAATDLAAPEQMIERQLDLAADAEWLDQLARDIATAGGGEGKLRFRLDPEHLGTLRVELAQGDRGTSVRLLVENEAARAIIAEAQPKLAAEARAQGVRIADTQVDIAGGHAGDPRRHEAGRRDPQLRTVRETATQVEPERPQRASSDRYA